MRTKDRVIKWFGFAVSLICSVCAGYFLAYNVYSTQLKERFDLSQTQVEIVGSFTVGGVAFVLLGSLIFDKYGHSACYLVGGILVASSGVLMWLATKNEIFFREWMAFLCIFQLLNSAGMNIIQNCCIAIALLHFSSRHSAKILGLYFATAGLGKIYYGALYQIFFETEEFLGEFFLTVSIVLTVSVALCCLMHKPPTDENNDTESLITGDNCDNNTTNHSDDKRVKENDDMTSMGKVGWTREDILKSADIHLILWPGLLCRICGICVLNNITAMAKSVDLAQPEVTVYIMAIGIVVSRLSFGGIFDFFRSQLAGFLLLLVLYVSFCLSMITGLILFDGFTIYAITVLVSIACGPIIPLTLGILVFHAGNKQVFFLAGLFEVLFSIFQILPQIFVGLTYDNTREGIGSKRMFCKECFYWMFVVFLAANIVSTIITLVSMCRLCWKNSH